MWLKELRSIRGGAVVNEAWVFSTVNPSTHEYVEYLSKVLSSRSAAVEDVLARKLAEAKSRRPRVERTFKVGSEVFEVKAYLLGSDIDLRSPAGLQVPLRIAANPAILVDARGCRAVREGINAGEPPNT